MSSFQHLADTPEDTVVVDIIFTTHGELSKQITAYKMRGLDSSSPYALQSRPMEVSSLTLTPEVLSLKLNVIMFDETRKFALRRERRVTSMSAAPPIYQEKKTLFVPEMLDAINHLHTSSETYTYESSQPIREHTGLFQMYPNLKTIPEKKFTAKSDTSQLTFAVFSNNDRLTETITKDIIRTEQEDGTFSLMHVIITTQGAIVSVVGRGKKVVINIIDVSCNALEERINTKIAQTPRGSVQYDKVGGRKTKRKGSRKTKRRKRRKTKRRRNL